MTELLEDSTKVGRRVEVLKVEGGSKKRTRFPSVTRVTHSRHGRYSPQRPGGSGDAEQRPLEPRRLRFSLHRLCRRAAGGFPNLGLPRCHGSHGNKLRRWRRFLVAKKRGGLQVSTRRFLELGSLILKYTPNMVGTRH